MFMVIFGAGASYDSLASAPSVDPGSACPARERPARAWTNKRTHHIIRQLAYLLLSSLSDRILVDSRRSIATDPAGSAARDPPPMLRIRYLRLDLVGPIYRPMQFEEFERIITDVMRKLIDSDTDGRQSVFNHLVIIERHQKHRVSWFPMAPQLVEKSYVVCYPACFTLPVISAVFNHELEIEAGRCYLAQSLGISSRFFL